MWYEHRRKSFVHQYEKKMPGITAFIPGFFFILECYMAFLCVRNAFETAGDVSSLYVYLAVGIFFAAFIGMIAGGVVLLKRTPRPWIPIIGIFLNGIMMAATLIVYAIGF